MNILCSSSEMEKEPENHSEHLKFAWPFYVPECQRFLLIFDDTCLDLIRITQITFLKYSRVHAILPKQLTTAGSWAFIKMIVSICWIAMGKRYHTNWLISSSISSNFPVMRSQISQAENAIKNVQKPHTVNSKNMVKSNSSSV